MKKAGDTIHLRRGTSHCLLGRASFRRSIVAASRWWFRRSDLSWPRFVGTVFRSFSVCARTHSAVNHRHKGIDSVAIVGRVFRETILARRIGLAGTELNQTFVLDAVVQILEALVIWVRRGVYVRLGAIACFGADFARDTEIAVSGRTASGN